MPRRSLKEMLGEGSEEGPRPRMNAYSFFLRICREEHKRRHPDENVEFGDFSRKCADRWKTMSEKEKRRFNQMAVEDKKRFEMEATMVPITRAKNLADLKNEVARDTKKPRKKRKIKDPNAPKRSMSAFFWFAQEERPKVKAANPDFTVSEVAKELARRWSEVTPLIKSKYESLAEKDRQRYDQDKRAYNERKRAEASGKPLTVEMIDSDENEDSD